MVGLSGHKDIIKKNVSGCISNTILMPGIYRVPLRRVFRKGRMPGDATWDEIYGKARCVKCRGHFSEGQAYRTDNAGACSHVDCPEKKKVSKKVLRK